MTNSELARSVMDRIEALAQISEETGRLTRTFCSPAMNKANELVGVWMREAGMNVSEDAIGNLIGRYPGRPDGAKTFILGSHLDTVRNALDKGYAVITRELGCDYWAITDHSRESDFQLRVVVNPSVLDRLRTSNN